MPQLPSPLDVFCGCLRSDPIGELADRAARAISQSPVTMSVTVNKDDGVSVVPTELAPESDILVSFDGGLVSSMSRRIAEDLTLEAEQRGIKPASDLDF